MNTANKHPPVGFIGIGQMGLGMALRLRDAGHPVWVRDLRADREALAAAAGAQVAVTPAALASVCTMVLVAVVDAAQVRELLFGPDGVVMASPRPATVLLCPTISPEDVVDAAARLAEAGIACVDAPMSGGPVRARDGSMSLMLAGDPAVLARHETVLTDLSQQRFVVSSRVGDGARTKLVNNLLAAVNLAGASEAMALAQQLGLDANTTLDVIERSSGQSWIGGERLRRALAAAPDQPLEVRAATALLAKDSTLAMAMAAQAGQSPALGAQAAAVFRQACDDGLTDHDDASLLAWTVRRQTRGA